MESSSYMLEGGWNIQVKTVRLRDNVVVEIIPEYALPVEKWYGAQFATQCKEAPDEVEQRWRFDLETETWSAPPPAPDPEPTLDDRVSSLETTKADQTDVDELNEALDMILTGYAGEEATDAEGTAG